MIVRNDLAVLAFQGSDAARFLHNQLTVDVEGLAPGSAIFASLCQPKGRVMALLCVAPTDAGFLVLCAAELADDLLAHLRRFVFRDKVELDRRDDMRVISGDLEGPDFLAVLEPLPGHRFGILGDSARDEAQEAKTSIATERARELQSGIAWLERASAESFLPQMLGHESLGALDFRKGCFPGQEVIARTRYLGKLKRHPWSGVVPERLPVPVLGEVTLGNGRLAAPGVLLDQARRADGRWQVFVVARRPEPFEVSSLEMAERTLAAEGRWLNDELDHAGDKEA